MNGFISKRLMGYYLLIICLLATVSLALAKEMTDHFIMAIVFGLMFFIVTVIFVYMTRVYIKPIDQLSRSISRLLDGDYVELEGRPLAGEVGKIINQVTVLSKNIHDMMEEQSLQARQLSAIIENAESGLLLIDEQGYILYVNRKFIEIFGDTPDVYKEKRYYIALHDNQIQEIIKQTFFLEEQVKGQTVMNHLHLDVIGVPIFSEGKEMRGVVLVIYDITKFKQLDIMRKDFVANVSHELKTPITSIKGFAETLLTSASGDKEAQDHFLQIILSESKRMQQLIDQLLLLSKMERKDPPLQLTDILMKDFLKKIMPLFSEYVKEKNLRLDLQIDDGIQLKADEQGLSQIIVNLLMNAIIYTKEGGKIQLLCTESNGRIKLMIKDTGIGIPEEEMPRIFERFYRIDADRGRGTGGTGLGLSIVKHIVEAHRGEITVQSTLNKGTTFTIYLPIDGPK